ncbi:MAG: hypothetical protein Q7U60_06400, partial [Candidatus Methanoperedens sp.]|nr:hypothetical protein [Candidatus Methanoperedens sp.]
MINVGSAEVSPNGIRLKDENRPWAAFTFITIPLNDTTQNEVIKYIHIPNFVNSIISNTTGNQAGMLTSDIEFYIDNEKKNFNEFFMIVNYNDTFKIIQKKDITLNKSTELKFKFNAKIPPNVLSFDKNNATFEYNSDFNLEPYDLFVQYVFRVPTANAQNIKLNFINSVLNNPNNIITSAPVSEVYATNKYLEISYLFW